MSLTSFGPGALRFTLAFLVLVEHVSRFQVGKFAVMAFFILSGYWVTRVYCEAYAPQNRGLTTFYKARFLRIWPLFALVALGSIAALALVGDYPSPETWLAFPILGIASHGIDPIGVSWSLDIELQFYLILPLLVALTGVKHSLRAVVLCGLFAAWVLGLTLSRLWGIETVLHYLPMFVAGMAIYLLRWQASATLAWASLALCLMPAVWAIALPEIRGYLLHGSGDWFADRSFAMIWAIYLIPFIAFNVQQASGWLDGHLGRLSFVLYLVHYPVIKFSRALAGETMPGDLDRLIVMIVSVVLSVALYVVIDGPLERLRQRLSRRPIRPQPPRDLAN